MTTTNLESAEISRRLEKLEQQNRWMKHGLISTAVAVSMLVLVAANTTALYQKSIETEQIIIRDQKGKKRIYLGVEDAKAALYLMDGNEKHSLVAVAHEKGGAGIDIAQAGQTRMTWTTGADKFAGLLFYANAGKDKEGQIGLFYTNDGKPMLFFNDPNHTTRAAIMLDKDRAWKPTLSLQDEKGKSFFSQAQP
jgi:hypothetical protein